MRSIKRFQFFVVGLGVFGGLLSATCDCCLADASRRFANSDSNAHFLHHIDLYDANSNKIGPESDQPYSSLKTCGRCHDYDTISHGWHFNALADALGADALSDDAAIRRSDGRVSEPWLWTDPRTGTVLPLSPRGQAGRFRPSEVGLSVYEMTTKFGARIPGIHPDWITSRQAAEEASGDAADGASASNGPSPRWKLSGALEIDCMVCHAKSCANLMLIKAFLAQHSN